MSPTRSIYDDIASLYAPIGAAVVVLVFAFTAIALLRSRRRAPGDPLPAEGRFAGNRLEGLYVVVLGLVSAGLVTASFLSFDRVQATTARAASVRVGVDAAKWRWRFVYPGGTSAIGLLVVPAGRPVSFVARSADVLHEFWVPEARFQRFVWPERDERWTLSFARGTYDGVCAWFCGLQHDRMMFTVRAVPMADFQRWLASQRGQVTP